MKPEMPFPNQFFVCSDIQNCPYSKGVAKPEVLVSMLTFQGGVYLLGHDQRLAKLIEVVLTELKTLSLTISWVYVNKFTKKDDYLEVI